MSMAGWCAVVVPAKTTGGVEQLNARVDAGLCGGVPGVPRVPVKKIYSREEENAKRTPRKYSQKISLVRENPLEHLERLEHGARSFYCQPFRCSMPTAKTSAHRWNGYPQKEIA